jgi:hypothetical protein
MAGPQPLSSTCATWEAAELARGQALSVAESTGMPLPYRVGPPVETSIISRLVLSTYEKASDMLEGEVVSDGVFAHHRSVFLLAQIQFSRLAVVV